MTEHAEHDQSPYDEADTQAQIEGLATLLTPAARVLDVGCGDGRIAAPLLQALGLNEIELVGLDLDPKIGSAFVAATGQNATFVQGDLFDSATLPEGPFDLILVLGNLLMVLREPSRLRAVLAALAQRLKPGGAVVIDDFAEGGWAELASGRWADGIDDSGSMQMVWLAGNPEFVVRMGEEVDSEASEPKPGERVLRLWSRRELDDAAISAGLGPATVDSEHLLSIHRSGWDSGED